MPAVYADYTYHRTPKTRYGIGPTRPPRKAGNISTRTGDNDTLQTGQSPPKPERKTTSSSRS